LNHNDRARNEKGTVENQLTWIEEWGSVNTKKGKTQTLAQLLWRENGRARTLILTSKCRMRDLGCLRGLGTLWASI